MWMWMIGVVERVGLSSVEVVLKYGRAERVYRGWLVRR